MSCGGGHLGFPIDIRSENRGEGNPRRNDHWKVLYKFDVFYADRKSKMATTALHKLTLDPMVKCSNAFFSKTTNIINAKLYKNVHWMVLYRLYVFCSDMKFKMAATAGLSLTLDPMGKRFQNASSLKPLGQLKPNCPGMIIGRSSTKLYFLCRSEIQDGRHRNT